MKKHLLLLLLFYPAWLFAQQPCRTDSVIVIKDTITGQTKTGDIRTDVKTGFSIPPGSAVSYDRATGTLTVKDETGKQVGTIPLTPELKDKLNGQGATTLTIQDRDGNIYTLTKDEQGNIRCEKTGSTGNGGAYSGQFDPNGISLREAAVTFSKGNGQYAFDLWRDDYEPVFLIRNKYENINGYLVACKLIPPGRTDKVAFTVTGPQAEKIDPDKIVFRTGTGTQYIAKNGEISITGGKENDAQDLYALYPDGNGKYTTLGKLKVLSYQELNLNLTLVRVKSNRVDPKSVENYLNNIYGPLGIHWTVSEDTDFNYDNENLDSEASGLFSRETPEMKALIAAYRATGRVDKHTLYLFVLKSGKIKEKGMAGDMPRRKQFGYIFTENASDILRTIAHELGHGRFELRHTFDNDYGKLVTGDNLMDYNGGTYLAKWQWDAMFDPALLINPFEEDDDVMDIDESRIKAIARIISTIQCAKSRNEKETMLYFPSNSIELKIKDIVSALSIAGSDCSDEKILFYVSNNNYSILSGNYVQDLFNVSTIKYDEANKQVIIQGKNSSVFISPLDKFSNKANCVYNFIKSLITGTIPTQGFKDVPTLGNLQYASPCEYETIKIENRKNLLQEASKEENWYNSSIKDSRQKIIIYLIANTPASDRKELYDYFSKNYNLLNKLYDKVDDYRDELLIAIVDLWKTDNRQTNAVKNIPIVQYALLYRNAFWKVTDGGTYEVYALIPAGGDPNWQGVHTQSIPLGAYSPFEAVNILVYTSLWSQFSGKADNVLLNVPAIVGRTIIGNAYKQDFYNYVTLGFSMVGINQTAIAAKLLTSGGIKSIAVWTKLALGITDVSTYAVEEYVKGNPNTEFSKSWIENRGVIYASLLVANLTDAAITAYANRVKRFEELFKKETGKEFSEIGANVAMEGSRFIANSGAELRTYLNSIVNKPTGVTYKGKMYRNIESGATYNPTSINPGMIPENNRFRQGLYLSESKTGNIMELNGSTTGRALYEMDVNVTGLLDLSDVKVVDQLGTTFDQMKRIHKDIFVQYEFTQEVAIWAKNNGYTGIKYYGAQGSADYINYVIFDQTTVINSITNIKSISW
ncbi:hypothetical protein FACS1894182_11800 [Bacteroidia bacterium]|nr:hypothetical protein FACS1894182_11800 [Bacteroidia bacterium]